MIRLRRFFNGTSKHRFAAGFLSCLLLFTALIATNLYDRSRDMAIQRQSGLGAVAGGWDPVSLWQQSSFSEFRTDSLLRKEGFSMAASTVPPPSPAADRKIVRTSSMSLIVSDPVHAVDSIRAIAQEVGGYTAGIRVSDTGKTRAASITIRVPASAFDQVRDAIHKMGSRVQDEVIESSDVTKQYVDYEATLKNCRAEEGQYLEIMRHATAVKDVLAVSEKLADVRGRVEKTEGEFRYLSQQVSMSAFVVSLHSETEAQVFGLRWRPLYNIRVAARDGLQSLANYADAMVALLMRLPAIALWVATLLLAVKYGWALLRRYWAGLIPRTQPVAEAQK